MSGDSDLVQMAREMIAENGRTVTFYQLDPTVANPAKPWEGAGVPATINPVITQAAFLPVHSLVNLGFLSKNDELLKSLENAVLIAPPATGEDLGTYHLIQDLGALWSIKKIEKLQPGDTVFLLAAGVVRATGKLAQ